MANMSYCRFHNTLQDLRDCEANLWEDLDGGEFRKRLRLIQLCKEIVDQAYDEEGVIDPFFQNEPKDEGEEDED